MLILQLNNSDSLARMWKVMAECHWIQRRILEEAMTLLPRKQSSISSPDPHRPAGSASRLETELKNWRARFESWIAAQRSYIQTLTGWLLRCVRSDDASPRRSSIGNHPVIGLCVEWSRQLEAIDEASVLEGIEYFTATVRSLCAQQVREDSRRKIGGWKKSDGNMEAIEAEEVVIAETMVEDEIMIICGGMSVAMSSLAEFACDSSERYDELVKQRVGVK
ncbi:uncharacterized protein LOC114730771 [Neltuma alba]|uniref:uncharacterized protein LOC114730771 n=1 Tax=Neltuma alba TaxID=207710 RepID=UPI0010A2B547|nr:uncharacterized protein LOC114730771 [Prosopis alba]